MFLDLEVLKWGAYIVAGVLGWFIRILWTAMEQMKKDFNDLEKNLPIAYVPREQFKDIIAEIKENFKETINPLVDKLERIEDRMEKRHDR